MSRDGYPSHQVEREAWWRMVARCHDQDYADYPAWGARGIEVCPEWRDPATGFAAFLAHVGPRPSPRHSIDRIDNAGNYQPGNVRWATAREQANNRRSNRLVTFEGRTQTLQQWADERGMLSDTLAWRLDHWPIERAMRIGDGRSKKWRSERTA